MMNVSPEELSSKYVKDALPVPLVVSIVSAVAVVLLCATPLYRTLPLTATVVIGMCGGVAFLFAICKVITVLALAGSIKKGNCTVDTATVTGYQFYTVRRLTYLYAVLDNNEFCNVWSSAFYKKGTEVYYVTVDSFLMKNEVMVKI